MMLFTKNYAVEDEVETIQIELRYSNYIEASDLDVAKVPQKNTILFYEMAHRLERIMKKLGYIFHF